MKRATDACVLASNNASPAQRGPRREIKVKYNAVHPLLSAVLSLGGSLLI